MGGLVKYCKLYRNIIPAEAAICMYRASLKIKWFSLNIALVILKVPIARSNRGRHWAADVKLLFISRMRKLFFAHHKAISTANPS